MEATKDEAVPVYACLADQRQQVAHPLLAARGGDRLTNVHTLLPGPRDCPTSMVASPTRVRGGPGVAPLFRQSPRTEREQGTTVRQTYRVATARAEDLEVGDIVMMIDESHWLPVLSTQVGPSGIEIKVHEGHDYLYNLQPLDLIEVQAPDMQGTSQENRAA